MKRTLLGICLVAAMSTASTAGAADASGQGSSPVPASRWSSSVMERHAPVDSARLQQLGQKKFRYMDMAQGKRSRSIRNAVIVRGPHGPDGEDGAQSRTYRKNSQPGRPLALMRPMT